MFFKRYREIRRVRDEKLSAHARCILGDHLGAMPLGDLAAEMEVLEYQLVKTLQRLGRVDGGISLEFRRGRPWAVLAE